MLSKVIQLIRAHRAEFLDRAVTAIVETVPRYGMAGAGDLRDQWWTT